MIEWLNRKKKEIAEFDLSSLTAAGWLLFLSSIIVPFAVYMIYLMPSTRPGMNRGSMKLIGLGILLVIIAWYQGGKFLLGKAGIRTHRTK